MTARHSDTARGARTTRPPWAGLTSALLVLFGSAVTLVVAAGPAAAHDVLVSTSPANGATVAQTPSQIVLTFTDPALSIGTQMVVTGPAGPVSVPPTRLIDNTVVQDLPGPAPAGHYTVLWRVTSADGHPVTGEVSFTSRTASAAKAHETTTTAPVTRPVTASGSGLPVGAILTVLILVAILAAVGRQMKRRRTAHTKDE